MDNNDLKRHRALPFPNGSPLYIPLIWASQSAYSKPGGTNCLDCDHSRPTVGQQQVFTQQRVLLDITLIKKMYCCPSDTQEAFCASLKPRRIKANNYQWKNCEKACA